MFSKIYKSKFQKIVQIFGIIERNLQNEVNLFNMKNSGGEIFLVLDQVQRGYNTQIQGQFCVDRR